MSKKINLTMPQPGETITEGTIVQWLVKPGDQVKEKQNVVELETEKAVFEYESPYEGKVLELLAKEGQTVTVGNSIAVFEVDDAKAQTYQMLGLGGTASKSVEAPPPSTSSRVVFSPLIRRLMQEYKLSPQDMEKIQGTGPGGRITKENILQYLDSRKKKTTIDTNNAELIPCSPVRLRIAENMIQSKKLIPDAHTSLSIDMTKIVEYRNQKKQAILPLVFPALKKAIQEHPLVNASFLPEEKRIALHKKINLGVAVGTEKGLFVPVVQQAQAKNHVEFSKELEALLQRVTDNKLSVQDLTGATFTFNNYGFYGTTIGVQIIALPQSTTLGMGRIEKRPWVVDDQIQIRFISDFTIAFDHRIMDGRDAGLFLLSFKKYLENFSEQDL